jgi:hypothetical protein
MWLAGRAVGMDELKNAYELLVKTPKKETALDTQA